MSGRRLNTHVHVRGQVYGPDSDVPPEVAEQITNPDVWDGDEPAAPPRKPAAVVEEPGEQPKPKRHARSMTPPGK